MQLLSLSYPPEAGQSTFKDHLDWLVQDGTLPEDQGYVITHTHNEDQLFTLAEFENGNRLILVESLDA